MLLLAFALRWSALQSLRASVYFAGLLPDEDLYHKLATRLAHGEDTATIADFPRLPLQVFALVYRIAGADPENLRFFNLGLGTLLCGLVYAATRTLYGKQVALLAGLLCAVNRSLVYFSISALKTPLALCLFAGCFWLLTALPRARGTQRHAISIGLGLVLGALLQVRANGAVIAVCVPVVLAGSRIRGAARAALIPVVLVGTLALTTAAALGGATGPRASWDLFIGNHRGNDTPYPAPVPFASSMPSQLSVGFVIEAARRLGRPVSEEEAAQHFAMQALHNLRADPGWALQHLGQKLRALAHSSTRDANQDLAMIAVAAPVLERVPLPSWLLIALGLAGLAAVPADPRRSLGMLVIASYCAGLLPFFVDERLRAPLLPIAACYGAAGLFAWTRAGARPLPALLLLALSFAAHLPLSGADDRSRALNMHATLLLDQGLVEQAELSYRRSLSLNQIDSPGALLGLAAIEEQRGERAQALQDLAEVPDNYSEAASKYEWLGVLWLRDGEVQRARHAFERSVDIDGSRLNAYKGLYIAQHTMGDLDGARLTEARLDEVSGYFERLTLGGP